MTTRKTWTFRWCNSHQKHGLSVDVILTKKMTSTRVSYSAVGKTDALQRTMTPLPINKWLRCLYKLRPSTSLLEGKPRRRRKFSGPKKEKRYKRFTLQALFGRSMLQRKEALVVMLPIWVPRGAAVFVRSLLIKRAERRLALDVFDTFSVIYSSRVHDVTDTDCLGTKMAALTVVFSRLLIVGRLI